MAINFPDSPSLNDIFTDETSGFTYQWDGEVWKSYTEPTIGNVTKLDDISGSFNGSTQTFPLTVNGTAAVADLDPASVLLSLGGVIQNPVQDYTINGTNITFTIPPANGLTFFATYFEVGISKDYISSGLVSPTGLSTGGFSWNGSGDLYISGVATVSNTGTASTALYVSGNARIAGILTVGSSSITFDGTNNRITGTGITISNDGIVSTAITATTYSGDGVNLVGAGLGTDTSINTTGIITASAFYGDATFMTDVGGLLDGIVYSPGVGATTATVGSNIEITFNKAIQANTGTITLRTGSSVGTIIESYDVTSSSNLTISGAKLTINPTDSLSGLTTYFVVVPANTVKDLYNTGGNEVIDTYSFTTTSPSFSIFTWGVDQDGELGQNAIVRYSSPVQIPGTQWLSIEAGRYTTVATKTDGTLWGWGNNVYGELGQNTVLSHSSPVQIPGTQWSVVDHGQYSLFVTKTDNTAWVWGYNVYGDLGLNTVTYYSSPVQLPGTQWSKFAGGRWGQSAIKNDGTLWTWGNNAYGMLALNSGISYSSPVQVPGTQWSVSSMTKFNNSSAFAAIKTDGTLWTCGRNYAGQLGQSNRTEYSSPIQVPGTQWSNVVVNRLSLATKTDGTLWAFGYNIGAASGAAGQNETSTYGFSSPVQIPGTQWNKIDSNSNSSFASKTDGTLWAWGANPSGQLGLNDRAYRSSPTQIPGTQWTEIISGSYHNIGKKQ